LIPAQLVFIPLFITDICVHREARGT